MIVLGMAGTPHTMSILLGLLVNNQDIQQRAYNYIKEAIGDRTPSYQDKVLSRVRGLGLQRTTLAQGSDKTQGHGSFGPLTGGLNT